MLWKAICYLPFYLVDIKKNVNKSNTPKGKVN